MPFPPPTEKQARLIWLAVTGLAMATLVALFVALIWGLGKVLHLLSPVVWPIAVAGVVACLLDPVVDFLERNKVPRTRAIMLVFAVALLVVVALFGSVVPQVVVETRQLASKIPSYVTSAQLRVENFINHPPALIREFLLRRTGEPAARATPSSTNAVPSDGVTNAPAGATAEGASPQFWSVLDNQTLESMTKWLAGALPQIGSWLLGQVTRVASWFGVLAGVLLIPIYAFYFLLESRGITARWKDYLPVTDSRFKEEMVFVLQAINDYLIAFFRGQVLVAVSDGVLYTIGFTIIGLPYSVLIGVMATCLTIIPYLGAITTCIVALLIAIANSGDWPQPLLVLVVVAVVQTLEGFVIQPRILGHRVGMHPLAIIIALMVGTTLLGGILGGVLAIPLAAALRVIMFRYVWKKREA